MSATTGNVRRQLESQIAALQRQVEKLRRGECMVRFPGHDMMCGEGPDNYKRYCSEACRLRAEIEQLKNNS